MNYKAQIYIVGTIDPFKDWFFCNGLAEFAHDKDIGAFVMSCGYSLDELRAIHKKYGEYTVFSPPVVISGTEDGPLSLKEKEQYLFNLLQLVGAHDEYLKFKEWLEQDLSTLLDVQER